MGFLRCISGTWNSLNPQFLSRGKFFCKTSSPKNTPKKKFNEQASEVGLMCSSPYFPPFQWNPECKLFCTLGCKFLLEFYGVFLIAPRLLSAKERRLTTDQSPMIWRWLFWGSPVLETHRPVWEIREIPCWTTFPRKRHQEKKNGRKTGAYLNQNQSMGPKPAHLVQGGDDRWGTQPFFPYWKGCFTIKTGPILRGSSNRYRIRS